MSIFSFAKDVGAKVLDMLTPDRDHGDDLKKHIEQFGLDNPTIKPVLQGNTVIVSGEVASQAEKEKILVALGNILNVEKVEDQITVSAANVAQPAASRFVTVESGDTLSKIAKRVYGDANKYQKIFEANKPMLSDEDKIYPGQVLRIPD